MISLYLIGVILFGLKTINDCASDWKKFNWKHKVADVLTVVPVVLCWPLFLPAFLWDIYQRND